MGHEREAGGAGDAQAGTPPVFAGRLLMLGFGCIGQGVLPLLLRHIGVKPPQITVVTADDDGAEVAAAYGVPRVVSPVTPDNLAALLAPRLGRGDFLLNLSVEVSSVELMALCRERGALYLDTCTEPWAGRHLDAGASPAQRSNYALREAALALRGRGGPTAVLTHGANPGLVSHFVKQALLDLAAAAGPAPAVPRSRAGWAALAQRLGVRVIHVAERDTQVGCPRKALDEFVNTWSASGFVSEGCQPAELGWGSHERHFPADARRHDRGSLAAIYLERPGAATRVRSWTPVAGPQHGFLVTHAESISIADLLTLGDPRRPAYRPTVHYAYRPCDDALLSLDELAARNWRLQPRQRVMKDEIDGGVDALGVLLMGSPHGTYWYGSVLSSDQARAAAPHNSATSLQVTAAVMAGVVWAIQHPDQDVVEPDDLPFEPMLALCRQYLGDVFGVFTDWTPLAGRSTLFAEDLDRDDPWQFKNLRVA